MTAPSQFAEIMNPVTPAVIDDMVARARQAKENGTVDRLRGHVGKLIRAAWAKAVNEGLEIGNCVRQLIDAGHASAPLAAAELATGQFEQDDPEMNRRSSAGILVTERVTNLMEERASWQPLTFADAMKEVLHADPQLAADYTGVQA